MNGDKCKAKSDRLLIEMEVVGALLYRKLLNALTPEQREMLMLHDRLSALSDDLATGKPVQAGDIAELFETAERNIIGGAA